MQCVNKGEGLAHVDSILATPDPVTGQSWDGSLAVDELMRIESEILDHTSRGMANVPDSVRRSIYLIGIAIGAIATTIRQQQLAAKGATETEAA